MRLARIIALALIAGSAGGTGLEAQVLRSASPPAEYPPASFAGKQYVDSRGCIYIRAGIGGSVTWVPRVTRSRKQICGYKPTGVAGATKQRQAAPGPEMITLPPEDQPAATTAKAKPAATPKAKAKPVKKASVKTPVAKKAAKPAARPVKRPPAAVLAKPRRAVKPAAPAKRAPQKRVRLAPNPAPRPAPAAQAPAAGGGCPGASALSQQYINRSSARCGPQKADPVTYGDSPGIGPQSALPLTPDTRIVQKHIYEERRLSNNFTVPDGFRPVWKDGRLNPRRAERTPRAAVINGAPMVPAGYVRVSRDDGRLNPARGPRGEQASDPSDRIWTRDVPRKLVKLPPDRPTVTLPPKARRSPAEARPTALRLSSRADPAADLPDLVAPAQSYIRAATLADPAQAQAAAQTLAARGLPVRLGKLSRRGQALKVVLAGPFASPAKARTALRQVQAAGFAGARLSK